jgi:hypothetical protein
MRRPFRGQAQDAGRSVAGTRSGSAALRPWCRGRLLAGWGPLVHVYKMVFQDATDIDLAAQKLSPGITASTMQS